MKGRENRNNYRNYSRNDNEREQRENGKIVDGQEEINDLKDPQAIVF